jgi:hypothetical protein
MVWKGTSEDLQSASQVFEKLNTYYFLKGVIATKILSRDIKRSIQPYCSSLV